MNFISGLSLLSIITVLANTVGWFWLKNRLEKSIQHEYNKQLADHNSELDKSKKIYDGKLKNYRSYLKHIDDYSLNSRNEIYDNFLSVMEKILTVPVDSPEFVQAQTEIPRMIFRQSEPFLRLKNEIQGLRLEAGETLLELLDKYVVVLGKQNDEFQAFISSALQVPFGSDEFQKLSLDFVTAQQTSPLNLEAEDLHTKIFNEMRNELNVV